MSVIRTMKRMDRPFKVMTDSMHVAHMIAKQHEWKGVIVVNGSMSNAHEMKAEDAPDLDGVECGYPILVVFNHMLPVKFWFQSRPKNISVIYVGPYSKTPKIVRNCDEHRFYTRCNYG